MYLSLAGRLKPVCSVSEFNLDGSRTTKGSAVRFGAVQMVKMVRAFKLSLVYLKHNLSPDQQHSDLQ